MPLILHTQRQFLRNIEPIDICDPPKHRIDASTHTRRSPHFAISDPARVRDPRYVGPVHRRIGPDALIRRCVAAIEDAGFGGDEGTGADGD